MIEFFFHEKEKHLSVLIRDQEGKTNICCCPGSNWGPLVCKTNVITTTPQQLVHATVQYYLYYINLSISPSLTKVSGRATRALAGVYC